MADEDRRGLDRYIGSTGEPIVSPRGSPGLGRLSPRRLELALQSKLAKSWSKQGAFVSKTTDRYKRGKPDLRVGVQGLGQLDVELKYLTTTGTNELTGLTRIQAAVLNRMNRHGMPAVGLIYVEGTKEFLFCNLLRADLTRWYWRVKQEPITLLSLNTLFYTAGRYLNERY